MTRKTSVGRADRQMEEQKKQKRYPRKPEKTLEHETDLSTPASDSPNGTDSPEADGSDHPSPEDESIAPTCTEKDQELESGNLITCSFSISLAIPLNAPRRKSGMYSRQDIPGTVSKMRESFIPRMHRFYHMEYFLLPEDIEPRKLDLVLFGPTARLFLDSESKLMTPKENERPKSKRQTTPHASVVKTWLERDQIWVSWNHDIEIDVTTDFLVQLKDHKIKLRLWDTKEKVCARARVCKPKGVALTHSEYPDGDGWVKRMVLFQRKHLQSSQAKHSYPKVRSTEKSRVKASPDRISAANKCQEEGSDAIEVPTPASSACGSKSEDISLLSISGSIPSPIQERTIHEGKRIKQKFNTTKRPLQTSSPNSDVAKSEAEHSPEQDKRDRSNSVFRQLREKTKGKRKSVSSAPERRPGLHRTPPKEAAVAAHLRKQGIASLELDLIPLLAGECHVACKLEEHSSKISNAYLSFSFDGPLMTEKQKQELNPLVIKILCAKCLPDTPVSIEELQRWCDSVYCKYKFHNLPPHRTKGHKHANDIYFKDINVILAGTIAPQELREYLRGPPLEIEVHDRDKKTENITKRPSLFGDEPGDGKLGHLNTLTGRYTLHNLLTTKEETWHPYGVAKISLSELLLGEKHLNISVPIHSCSVQDTSICMPENVTWKSRGADHFLPAHLPMGHYLDSEATLKLRIEISIPLEPEEKIADTETNYCPYGCIIYIFDYKNRSLLNFLLQEITEINAKAFQLDSYPLHIIQKSLNILKLTSKLSLKEISQMDIITGFHIMDGSIHLLVVEGLKDKALKDVWDKRIDRIKEAKSGRLEIFYNSQVSFHQRLYVDLEAILFHIRLCKPLSSIIKQPLLYVRDMVPLACFQALSRLDYICHSKKLRAVVHYDLLPTAEMIISLGQEFGIPLAKDDLLIHQSSEIMKIHSTPTSAPRKWKRHSVLDNQNEQYILRKREMESQTPQDYIQANIENVDLLSKMMQHESLDFIRAFPSDGKSIFNYSTQHLNSAEMAKHLLRQEMKKEKGKSFAYSHKYLSGMFAPVDEDSARKESIALSKKKWLTSEGFVFPGFKSSLESNLHPRMPDEARIADLTEKWEENILHRNILKPVLDRDRWTWDKREVDFDLYTKPTYSLVAFDTYVDEHQQDERCNTALKVHRCCPGTEVISSGPKASCQLARLQGLLKDKPVKLALKSHGKGIQDIPVVGGIGRVESGICKGFIPGSDDFHSLKWNGNVIPCYDREYSIFKTLRGADFRLICHNHSYNYKWKPPQSWLLKNEMPTAGHKQEAEPVAPHTVN